MAALGSCKIDEVVADVEVWVSRGFYHENPESEGLFKVFSKKYVHSTFKILDGLKEGAASP